MVQQEEEESAKPERTGRRLLPRGERSADEDAGGGGAATNSLRSGSECCYRKLRPITHPPPRENPIRARLGTPRPRPRLQRLGKTHAHKQASCCSGAQRARTAQASPPALREEWARRTMRFRSPHLPRPFPSFSPHLALQAEVRLSLGWTCGLTRLGGGRKGERIQKHQGH